MPFPAQTSVNEKVLLFFSSVPVTPGREGCGQIIRAFECVSFPGSYEADRQGDANNDANTLCS